LKEKEVCDNIGCEIIFGVGGYKKELSTSYLISRACELTLQKDIYLPSDNMN